MRPAFGCLCVIIVVFVNSIVLDAMMDPGGSSNCQGDDYDIAEGSYVTMYIVNVGAFHGSLYPAPARQGALAPNVPNRFYVHLPNNRRFIADLESLFIKDDEHLTESRYFIQIRYKCGVSGVFGPDRPSDDARVIVMLHLSESTSRQITLFAEMDYYDGDVKMWTNRKINRARLVNLQYLANLQRTAENRRRAANHRRDHGGSGAGPSHGPPGQ